MSDFKDKVALVTGAARGIGRATAEALAARGAALAVCDLTPTLLGETAERIRAAGGRVKEYVHDTAKKMPAQALITQVLEDWERIDILVNGAFAEPQVSLLGMDEWDWLRALDVNLNGPYFMMQSVGRVMQEAGGGVMVNIAPPEVPPGAPGRAAWAAGQEGLVGLTREAARELAPYNIRVNAVCPGLVETEAAGWLRKDPPPAGAPRGRLGTPDEVAQVVVFLCSPAAELINGQALFVGRNEAGV
jgi:3-oxoacyl-[acyl-carrier protein] reductase/2-hydroxycyclohexanecarboxyl-CoA dehydrogenase